MPIKNWLQGVVAAVLLSGLLCTCGKETQPASSTAQPAGEKPASPAAGAATQTEAATAYVPLSVYRFDTLNGHLYVSRTIEVEPHIARREALETLLATVNETLSGNAIRMAGIDQTEHGDILVLDLIDTEGATGVHSWYNAFQGSTGGAATQGFLVATFLQPAYDGDWYDGVRFLLNGKPMSEMDHVNLSGVFLRSKPMGEHMIVSMSEPGEMTEEEIAEFLHNMLELPDDARFNLARVRLEDGTTRVVFFTSSSIEMVHRGVLQVVDGVPRILFFEQDPCYCFAVAAEPRELVRGRGEFVVTRFSPLGGTCVASDVVRILALEDDGTLVEVWRGTTFEADGPHSRVASVEFVDKDGDGNLEILRKGELIDCGEDCFCREGTVLETFEALFEWSPEKDRFVEVP